MTTSDGPPAHQAGRAPLDMPRLLAFYQDVWDEDGTLIGWRTIAWGLAFADGSVVSVPAAGPPAATVWHSVDDAATALDAYIDTPNPRRTVDVSATAERANASATTSPRSSDDAAAQTACPGDPGDAGEGRDRPLAGGESADEEPGASAGGPES